MSVVCVNVASFMKVAVLGGIVAAAPQLAEAKTSFSKSDLAAVGLEAADVSPAMQSSSFSISAVLPWMEQVREEAAKALAEM